MLFKIIRIIVSNKFLLEKSLKEKAEELHYFNPIYGIFARHASSTIYLPHIILLGFFYEKMRFDYRSRSSSRMS